MFVFIWLIFCVVGIVLLDVIFVNVLFGIGCLLFKVKYCLILLILNDCFLVIVIVVVLVVLIVWYLGFIIGLYVIIFVVLSVVDELLW